MGLIQNLWFWVFAAALLFVAGLFFGIRTLVRRRRAKREQYEQMLLKTKSVKQLNQQELLVLAARAARHTAGDIQARLLLASTKRDKFGDLSMDNLRAIATLARKLEGGGIDEQLLDQYRTELRKKDEQLAAYHAKIDAMALAMSQNRLLLLLGHHLSAAEMEQLNADLESGKLDIRRDWPQLVAKLGSLLSHEEVERLLPVLSVEQPNKQQDDLERLLDLADDKNEKIVALRNFYVLWRAKSPRLLKLLSEPPTKQEEQAAADSDQPSEPAGSSTDRAQTPTPQPSEALQPHDPAPEATAPTPEWAKAPTSVRPLIRPTAPVLPQPEHRLSSTAVTNRGGVATVGARRLWPNKSATHGQPPSAVATVHGRAATVPNQASPPSIPPHQPIAALPDAGTAAHDEFYDHAEVASVVVVIKTKGFPVEWSPPFPRTEVFPHGIPRDTEQRQQSLLNSPWFHNKKGTEVVSVTVHLTDGTILS